MNSITDATSHPGTLSPPIEVVRHRALADLFAEERDDVGAGPDRQDVPVPYRLDEPVQRPGDDERVDR